MQTDISGAVHLGRFWFDLNLGTRPAGPTSEVETAPILRSFMGRLDLFQDHMIVRAGFFIPKFGLMLSDHTAYVRIAAGLGPDAEQTQAEMIYQDDLYELTSAVIVKNESFDKKGSYYNGLNLGASGFFNSQRVNLNFLYTNDTDEGSTRTMMNLSASAVLSWRKDIYAMMELDRLIYQTSAADSSSTTQALTNYLSAHVEVFKGVIPYLRFEFWDTDLTLPYTNRSRWGVGTHWYPRPHFQTEFRLMRSISSQGATASNQSDFILHYYF